MKTLIEILTLIILLTGVSCRRTQEPSDNLLLRYGEEELKIDEVISKIPTGLLPSDSATLFNSIVESWIEDHVISDFAEERLPDLNNIEQKVAQYRRSLIVQEYLTRMRESNKPTVDEKRVKDYYDKHRSEMKLEVPLIKGIYMKINSNARGKEGIRALITSDNPNSIDKLEQEWLDRALEYNYFRDKWIDWETLSSLIPYRFGDPEKFLEENNFFELDQGDSSYYLVITDYLPSGEEQPYEFAKTWITGVLNQSDLNKYQENLIESLVQKAIKDKKLETPGYDLLKQGKKVKKEKETNE